MSSGVLFEQSEFGLEGANGMKYWVSMWLVCIFTMGGICSGSEKPVQFNRDVRPILSDRCYHCHGPDEGDRQAGLRLDIPDGDEGAYQVIEPGAPDDSELWHRISSEEDDVMPPPDMFAADGYHPNAAGISEWSAQVADQLSGRY